MDVIMQKESFIEYRKQGFTTIANALLASYNQLKIGDQQLILLLQLERFAQQNNFFPSNELLASQTNFSTTDVGRILQSLIDHNFISIVQNNDSNGLISDEYSLNPLYEKLSVYLENNVPKSNAGPTTASKSAKPAVTKLDQTVRQFEIEFGRMLSPIELQMIQSWFTVDHYDVGVIKLALRESVLAQVYNFKYVDRILLNWQRMNLKTPLQVERYLQQ